MQDAAYGCQRYLGGLKHMLAQMLKKPIDNPQLESLLLAALYQLHYAQRAARRGQRSGGKHSQNRTRAVPFVCQRDFLRRFLRERDKLAASCKKDDVAKHNLPLWWVVFRHISMLEAASCRVVRKSAQNRVGINELSLTALRRCAVERRQAARALQSIGFQRICAMFSKLPK